MDIYLVRHGEAAASWGQASDPGLSSLGQEQAAHAARELQRLLPAGAELVSSPLLRARETAQPLAEALALPVRIDDAYAEIPSPVALAERQNWLREFMQQQWQQQPESLHAWRDGICQNLLALHRPTVVFSHFLVLNAVVGWLQQSPQTLCFWPDNGCITRLQLGAGELKLLALGREMTTVVN